MPALLLMPLVGFAHHFSVVQYGQRDGLRSLTVTSLAQDRHGNLWVGSEHGLFRYDGIEYRSVGSERGLAGAHIHGLLEDGRGRIWVGTAEGLWIGDGSHFVPVTANGQTIPVDPGATLIEAEPQRVLLVSHGRLLAIKPPAPLAPGEHDLHVPVDVLATPAPSDVVTAVYTAPDRSVWLGCGKGLCRAHPGGWQTYSLRQGLPEDEWIAVHQDRQGRLWARGRKHLVMRAPEAERFAELDPPQGDLPPGSAAGALAEDPQGRILVRTQQGLARWDRGHWEHLTSDNGLPRFTLTTVLFDREGTPWMGLAGRGLGHWVGYGQVETWTADEALGTDTAWSMVRTRDGRLLVGTGSGCRVLNDGEPRAHPCGLEGLPDGEILTIREGADGSLWFAKTTGELLTVAPGSRHARRVAQIPQMRALLIGQDGTLWVATSHGLLRRAPRQEQPLAVALPWAVGEVTDIAEDAAGNVWFASQGGLLRWNGSQFDRVSVDDGRTGAGFTSLAIGRDGWLWVGATASGIARIHVDGVRADRIEWVTEPMVASADLMFLRIDPRSGWLWVGTDQGVVSYDGRDWRRFSVLDGLAWNDVNQNSFLADRDGSVWIGSTGGLTHLLHPDWLAKDPPLALRIDTANLGGQILDPAGGNARPVRAGAHFDVLLAIADFRNASQLVIRNRLVGLGDEWSETRERALHFPALPSGHYQLETYAVDREHHRSSPVLTVAFDVQPPWSESPAFRLLVVLGVAALLALAWQWRERQNRAREAQLEARLREHAELLRLATRDGLTGIWNRQSITDQLRRAVVDAHARTRPLGLAIMDLDHFKQVNDSFGHGTGDRVLQAVSARLQTCLQDGEVLGRLGGEEFLILLPDLAGERLTERVEHLRAAVEALALEVAGTALRVTASFGVASLAPGTDDAPEHLLERADRALYAAKRGGRNRVSAAVETQNASSG